MGNEFRYIGYFSQFFKILFVYVGKRNFFPIGILQDQPSKLGFHMGVVVLSAKQSLEPEKGFLDIGHLSAFGGDP